MDDQLLSSFAWCEVFVIRSGVAVSRDRYQMLGADMGAEFPTRNKCLVIISDKCLSMSDFIFVLHAKVIIITCKYLRDINNMPCFRMA